jgi:DUF438 domain-containing protein
MHLINHIAHEHKHLLAHIEQLKTTAEAVGSVSDTELRRQLIEAHDFLAHHLIPHAISEDEALYPLVAKYMGAPDATTTMTREHEEVAALTARLHQLMQSSGEQSALREVLYGLYAIISLHFKKEEELYLPVLREHLTTSDDEAAFHLMEEAHSRATKG